MNKEQEIQKCQNVLKAIDGNIWSIYNYFDGDYEIESEIGYAEIYDGEANDFSSETKGVKDEYLEQAVKDAHNKYVLMLAEWQEKTSKKLNELLITNNNEKK